MDNRILIRKFKIDKAEKPHGNTTFCLMRCLECGIEFKVGISGYNQGGGLTCGIQCRAKRLGKFLTGGKHTEEHKEKIRISMKGKTHGFKKGFIPWIKGKKMPKEFCETLRRLVSEGKIGMKGKHHTEETKKKIGLANSIALKGRKLSEKHRKKISEATKGEKNPMYGISPGHKKGYWYFKKDNTKIWMRSSYEIKFAKWLDKKNLKWEYEPKRFELKDRTYCPDFWIKDWNKWIETKGWFNGKDQETIKQFRELYPKEPLVVLTEPLLKAQSIL